LTPTKKTPPVGKKTHLQVMSQQFLWMVSTTTLKKFLQAICRSVQKL